MELKLNRLRKVLIFPPTPESIPPPHQITKVNFFKVYTNEVYYNAAYIIVWYEWNQKNAIQVSQNKPLSPHVYIMKTEFYLWNHKLFMQRCNRDCNFQKLWY